MIAALLGLTFVTGLVDAASVLGLGHVFVANMTGNVVFMGFAAVGEGISSFAAGALALAAFLFGALVGGQITAGGPATPSRRGFAVELCFFTVATALSFAPDGAYRTNGVIAFLALAMGVRNALVRKLAIADMTTTVLTLTLTGIAADSSLAGGQNPRLGRRLGAVAAMLSGAALGAVLLARAPGGLFICACAIEAISVLFLIRAFTPHPTPAAGK